MATTNIETSSTVVESTLIQEVVELLEAVKTKPAVKMIKDPANIDRVKEAAWDLVPQLCSFLTSERELETVSVVCACEEILQYLSDVGNAKELLLVLLEQADMFKDDIKFKALLRPVQRCLQRLPSRKGNPIGIALETLCAHIQELPLPEDYQLEDAERQLLEADETVRRICSCVTAILTFIKPFAEEVSWKNRHTDTSKTATRTSNKQVKELMGHLMKILSHPLAFIDLSVTDSSSISRGRECAERLVTFMSYLHADFHKALVQILEDNHAIEKEQKRTKEQQKDSPADMDELDTLIAEPVSKLGLGTFAYLVFGENLYSDNVPCVYRLEYLFEFNLPFMNALLETPESMVRLKGVALFVSLLEHMPALTLSSHLLEFAPMKQLLQNLLHVIVYCPPKDIRQSAVKGLSSLLQKFELAGRYMLILILLKSSTHAGVTGYVIQLLKNEIDRNLKSDQLNAFFCGSQLEKLLRLIFTLPEGVETDLLDQSECVMAALNLLRYLVLRDKPSEDFTGIWQQIPRLQEVYCGPLQTAIDMSHAHYALDIERTAKGECMADSSLETSLSVSGHVMPEMDDKQRMSLLTTALHTFDMMQSILSRVTELIDIQRKTQLENSA